MLCWRKAPWMKNITRMRKFLHMNGRQSHLLLPLNYKQATHLLPLLFMPTPHLFYKIYLQISKRGYFILLWHFLVFCAAISMLGILFYFIIFLDRNIFGFSLSVCLRMRQKKSINLHRKHCVVIRRKN